MNVAVSNRSLRRPVAAERPSKATWTRWDLGGEFHVAVNVSSLDDDPASSSDG
jgi:hypothetical protein